MYVNPLQRVEMTVKRLVETNVVLGRGRFRGVRTGSSPGTGETGHTTHHTRKTVRHTASTAEFRGHLVDKGHYLWITLVLEKVSRVGGDLLKSFGHFRILQVCT